MGALIITIGMPIKNRIDSINMVLDSILSQTYPKKAIKIVFVDESTDGTYERLLNFKEIHEEKYLEVQLIKANSQGFISVVRNTCVSHMAGDVIIFWDSDVLASNNEAIDIVIQKLISDNSIGAAGYNYERKHPSFYENILRLRSELGGMGFTAIKKSVFVNIGPFDERLRVNEDTELLSRMKFNGYKIILVSKSPFLHLKPSNATVSIKQNFTEFHDQMTSGFLYESLTWELGIRQGSLFSLIRAVYYLIIPLFFTFWAMNLIKPIFSILVISILLFFYLLLHLTYHVWKMGVLNRLSLMASAYYIPLGIAKSYGLVVRLLKKHEQ